MIKTGIARRYAKALFGLVESAQVEATRAGLTALAQATAESKTLRHVLASPAFTFDEKHDVLGGLSHRLGCPPIVNRFLGQLIKKNRLGFLAEIAEEFTRLADQQKGTKQIQVASEKPLNAAEQEQLKHRLAQLMGQTVDIAFHTDPGLLAGLKIMVGSTVFDSSVKSRLAAMRTLVTKE